MAAMVALTLSLAHSQAPKAARALEVTPSLLPRHTALPASPTPPTATCQTRRRVWCFSPPGSVSGSPTRGTRFPGRSTPLGTPSPHSGLSRNVASSRSLSLSDSPPPANPGLSEATFLAPRDAPTTGCGTPMFLLLTLGLQNAAEAEPATPRPSTAPGFREAPGGCLRRSAHGGTRDTACGQREPDA